jgi:hypothetical protein
VRPTPAELITQVRRILRDAIEPELASDYARARLAEVRAVLAQVDWDDAALKLVETAGALRDLVERCRNWIETDETRKDHFASILPGFSALPTSAPVRFADWNDARSRYAEMIIVLIDPLEDWLTNGRDDGTGRALRQELLHALAQ